MGSKLDELLAEVRKLDAAATKGPWENKIDDRAELRQVPPRPACRD